MDSRRRVILSKHVISGGSSGGGSGGDSSGTYTVDLNSQWEETTAVPNPDSSLYNGVYRSSSNYNVHNTAAIMYIDISGLTSFKLYIRSYAESSYDYVMVSQLDQTINNSTSYSNTSLVKSHTRGNQQSGTALSSYTLVEFTGIDGGSHRITIVYRKDSSANSGDDRGYVLIPKSQGSGEDSGGGDVDIDTTYSIMYTSSDGNVVTPYRTTVFDANITSNAYVNGQGIITFDGPVTSIGYEAFYYRSSLTSVNIPNSVTSIGERAFYYCTSLTSVTIPEGVTSIGREAFRYCSRLVSVYCKATTPPSLGGTYAFGNNGSGRKIYVPAGSVDVYKSATNWSNYASDIVGYDFEGGSGGNDGSGELITFTVDGIEYQAEEGMTWGEWVDSDYNVNGDFGIDSMNNSVGYGDKEAGLYISYVGTQEGYVFASDIIQESYGYVLV